MYRTNLNDNYPPDELNAANGTELPPLRVNQRTSDAGHSSEHVVEIPTTPRGDERGMDIAPPIKEKRKKKKKKRDKERVLEQSSTLGNDSDVSSNTYTMPSTPGYHVSSTSNPTGSPQAQTSPVHIPYKPVIDDPPLQGDVSGMRIRRRSASTSKPSNPERRHTSDDSKSKKLRKKKSKSKDKRELGVQLAVDSVRQYVKQHFRQYSYTEQETGSGQGQDQVDARPPMQSTLLVPALAESRDENPLLETSAYGRINFRSDGKSAYEPPYVCITDKDDMDDLVNLMFDHWKLADPKLIVSIVGGAKRFQFSKNRISTLFKQGLLDVATTTGAWILTPGSHTGVYSMVGSAVKDHIDTAGSSAMNDIVLLGIASWGSVASRDKLECPKGDGRFPASYPITELKGKKGTQPLDPNHSHFILIDDGSRDTFGGEIKWRANFEKFLMEHEIESIDTSHEDPNKHNQPDAPKPDVEKVHIPLVTLLVNGGDGSLEACAESLCNQIPLVAIVGSGRAAEVVILIHKFIIKYKKQPSETDLKRLYRRAMDVDVKDKMMDSLKKIAQHNKYVSAFDFIQTGINTDDIGLDRAILSALYHKEDMDLDKRKAQLKLALAWNRVDYARDEIFSLNNPDLQKLTAEKEFLYDVAMQALLDDMPEFMALLIDHGLDLSKFVCEERLEKLYQKAMQKDEAYTRYVRNLYDTQEAKREGSISCNCLNKVGPKKSYMHTIGRLFKELLGYSFPNIYKQAGDDLIPVSAYKAEDCVKFKDPAQHLFMWAVLFNKMDLAKMFWKFSDDHIAGAIVGAAIQRGLAKKSNHQEGVDITAQYQENSLEFEALANGILKFCWDKDRQYTSDMLVRVAPNWGNSTVLSMAHSAEMEEFLAQPACYTKLNKIWRGDIALRTNIFWVVLFALLPVFSFMLTFVRKNDNDPRMDERQNDPAVLNDLNTDDSEDKSPVVYKPLISVTCSGQGDHAISYFNSMYRGFRAPLVKCIHYMMFFIFFLCVYSLFLMTELRPYAQNNVTSANYCASEPCCLGFLTPGVGCLEIITYVCVMSMFIEEIRQVLLRDSRPLKYIKQKLRDWISDFWNQVDCVSYTLFISAIVTRFYVPPAQFELVYWLFSFSLLVYFIRFSQLFFVVEQLGPKIIMIKKMLVDLVFFIMILLVTMFAFGVIKTSILYPQSPLSWNILNQVLYQPYFQMYGELFLEDESQYSDSGYKWILLGVYMMITNVLLLNLLIAMFSYTFDQVQGKAEILWKYNYYAVVYEHFDKPYFGVLGTIIQIIRMTRCVRSCTESGCCRFCSSKAGSDFRRELEPDHNKKITKFVKVCMEKYVNQQARLAKEDVTHKVSSTARRLELVIEQLDDLREDVLKQEDQDGRTMSTSSPSLPPPSPSHHTDRGLDSKLNEILMLLRRQDV